MRFLRHRLLSPMVALITCFCFLLASTEVATANTLDTPMAWHQADATLPAPIPLVMLDSTAQVDDLLAAGAPAVEQDTPQVVAAPMEGAGAKGLFVILGIVFVAVLVGITLGVLFFLDLTTDFDLFPDN